jgi:hypothetical protein
MFLCEIYVGFKVNIVLIYGMNKSKKFSQTEMKNVCRSVLTKEICKKGHLYARCNQRNPKIEN